MSENTNLSRWEKEIEAWSTGFMNRPVRTFVIGIVLIIFIGLAGIAPRVFGDLYSWAVPPAISNPFKGTQTIYSNIVPQASDIIDLDHAGDLTPSPYNLRFTLSQDGSCIPMTENAAVDYSQGIVLVLNIHSTLSSQKGREISFKPPPPSSYFVFEKGTTHIIKSKGRIFDVTLARIDDQSTELNGPYFAYVFDINEM